MKDLTNFIFFDSQEGSTQNNHGMEKSVRWPRETCNDVCQLQQFLLNLCPKKFTFLSR